MNRKILRHGLCLGLLVCFLTGCGPKVVPISGKVTLSGTPIEDCLVTFQPTSKNEIAAASGKTGADGRFELKTLESPQRIGAVPGEYTVKFFWRDPKNDSVSRTPPYKIPSKFQNTGIIVEISSGKEIDFDLVP